MWYVIEGGSLCRTDGGFYRIDDRMRWDRIRGSAGKLTDNRSMVQSQRQNTPGVGHRPPQGHNRQSLRYHQRSQPMASMGRPSIQPHPPPTTPRAGIHRNPPHRERAAGLRRRRLDLGPAPVTKPMAALTIRPQITFRVLPSWHHVAYAVPGPFRNDLDPSGDPGENMPGVPKDPPNRLHRRRRRVGLHVGPFR